MLDQIKNTPSCIGDDWLTHPLGRGLGAGVTSWMFSARLYRDGLKSGLQFKGLFRNGFIYGGVAGVANIMLHPIFCKINSQLTSPADKKINEYFSSIFPWIISYKFMQRCHYQTNKSFYRLNPMPALMIAYVIESFSVANQCIRTDKQVQS